MNKNLSYYFYAITVICILALIISLFSLKPSKQDSGELLYPNLKSQINQLNQIIISDKNYTTTLILNDKIWQIKERYNLPANINYIQNLILNISDSYIKETKTNNPELYSKLGIDPKTSIRIQALINNSKSKEKKASNDNNKSSKSKLVIDHYVGNIMPALESAYILTNDLNSENDKNKDKHNYVVLTSNDLRAMSEPGKWLDNFLINFTMAEIKQITLVHQDDKDIKIYRNNKEEKDFKLKDIPENFKLKSQDLLNNTLYGAVNLLTEDIVPLKQVSFSNNVTKINIETFSNIKANLEMTEAKNKKVVKINYITDSNDKDIIAKVKNLNNKTRNWAFYINDNLFYTFNQPFNNYIIQNDNK